MNIEKSKGRKGRRGSYIAITDQRKFKKKKSI